MAESPQPPPPEEVVSSMQLLSIDVQPDLFGYLTVVATVRRSRGARPERETYDRLTPAEAEQVVIELLEDDRTGRRVTTFEDVEPF